MIIEVKVFSSLRHYISNSERRVDKDKWDIGERATVEQALKMVGLPDEEVRVLLINGRNAKRESILQDLQATLAGITTANGYASDVRSVGRRLKHWDKVSEFPVLFLFAGDEPIEHKPGLMERGIWASAIRPPTVPQGSARLRVTLTASHSEGDIEQLLNAMQEVIHG